jgi:hypothetical protein
MMNFFSTDNRAIHAEAPHTFYQIDYASANCGRIVPMSKRRIRFKFGYTNMTAVYDGLVGQECRGEEHEISIEWSLSSGKQSIEYDGKVIFINVCDMTDGKMTHSWYDKDGHYLKVIVHSLSTSLKQTQDAEWRQYDLLVDGISYFRAPKIYQIGLFPNRNNAENKDTTAEQPHLIKPAEPEPTEIVDLLSFDEFPVTPTGQAQTVTPHASPQNNNAILLPFIGFNAPQQNYTNYTY